jgi:hypothetical protein
MDPVAPSRLRYATAFVACHRTHRNRHQHCLRGAIGFGMLDGALSGGASQVALNLVRGRAWDHDLGRAVVGGDPDSSNAGQHAPRGIAFQCGIHCRADTPVRPYTHCFTIAASLRHHIRKSPPHPSQSPPALPARHHGMRHKQNTCHRHQIRAQGRSPARGCRGYGKPLRKKTKPPS